jgi:hypothetical protein
LYCCITPKTVPPFGLANGTSTFEEQQIGLDGRIWGEHAVGQAHNRMQIEVFQEFFPNAGAHTVTE